MPEAVTAGGLHGCALVVHGQAVSCSCFLAMGRTVPATRGGRAARLHRPPVSVGGAATRQVHALELSHDYEDGLAEVARHCAAAAAPRGKGSSRARAAREGCGEAALAASVAVRASPLACV
jgi:hypothetical protein